MKTLMKPIVSFFLLFLLTGYFNSLKASHVTGVNISYNKISNDSIEINVDVIRDCAGQSWNTQRVYVNVRNSCNYSSGVFLNLQPAYYPNPFTGIKTRVFSNSCVSSQNNLRCNSGQLTSYEVYTYKGVFVLPANANCPEWKFRYMPPCCINTGFVNVYPNVNDYHAEATFRLDNTDVNATVEKTTIPIFHGCVNQKNGFSLSDKNPDLDSLVYYFSPDSRMFQAHNIPKILGPSTFIDSTTGFFSFTPSVVGDYILPIVVEEYDRKSKLLKGRVYRVSQVKITNCSNKVPDTSGVISNVSTQAVQLDNQSIEACAGASFSFDTYFTDPDTSDSIQLFTDIGDIMPWAQINENYIAGSNDTIQATISGAIPLSTPSGVYSFYVRATDNHCPMLGQRFWQYKVHVQGRASAGEDKSICQGGQWVDLSATGGTSFKWKVLSGSPFDTISSSGGYNATATVHGEYGSISVSPATTTTYEVTSLNRQNCFNKDTVVVKVGPDFNWNTTYNDKLCYGGTSSISIQTSGGGTSQFSYDWSPSGLIDSTQGNFAMTKPIRYDTEIRVTISSSHGCVKYDTLPVEVKSLPFPTNISITPNIGQLCNLDTAQLVVKLRSLNEECGLSNSPCQGSERNVTSSNNGTRSSVQSSQRTLPNILPTGNFGSKTQFIYKKSLLKSMGLEAGYINSLSFDVSRNPNVDSIINNLSVKLKCTSIQAFSNLNFEFGAVQVSNISKDTIDDGWWKVDFDQSYFWDGQSNLLIEVAWNNSSSSSQNQEVNYLTTSYNAGLWYAQVSNNGTPTPISAITASSGANGFSNPYQYVPVIRFGVCDEVNTAGYNFQWSTNSSNGIIGSSTADSIGFFNSNFGNYQVKLVVTDTSGYCIDSAFKTIEVGGTYSTRPLANALEVCINEQPFALKPPSLTVSQGLSAQWTGPGVINGSQGAIFDAAKAGVGLHQLIYEISGNRCGVKDTFEMRVSSFFDASFDLDHLCMSDSLVNLDPASIGGSWTGPGIFDSSIAQIETSQLGLSLGSGEVDSVRIIHIIDSLGCLSGEAKYVKVSGEFVPKLDMSGAENPLFVCANGDNRVFRLIEGQGTWSGSGISVNGEFDPKAAGVGSHVVSVDSNGFCGGSNSYTVVVPQLIEPIIENPGPFCDPQYTGMVTLNANTSGNWSAPRPSGTGSWTPTASSGSFIPSAVVQTYGHGNYSMILSSSDTIYSDSLYLNICMSKDTSIVSFVEEIEVDLGPDVYTCERVVDTILDVGTSGRVRWSTGDTTTSIRITSHGTYWVTKQGYGTNCLGTDTITFHSGCLAVEPVLSSSGVSLFPNPTISKFLVRSLSKEINGVSVISMEGKTVFEIHDQNVQKVLVKVDDWPAGVYCVIIVSEEKTYHQKVSVY